MAEFLSIVEEAALERLTRAPGPSLGSAPRYPDPRRRLAPPRRAGVPVGAPDPMVALLAGVPASAEQLALAALEAGELFEAFGGLTATAGQNPNVQLFNPGSSNRLVQVLSIRAAADTTSVRLNLVEFKGPNGTFLRRGRNLAVGQPGSVAEVYTDSSSGAGADILGSTRTVANDPVELVSVGAIELVPGSSVYVVNEAATGTLNVAFVFRESLLP